MEVAPVLLRERAVQWPGAGPLLTLRKAGDIAGSNTGAGEHLVTGKRRRSHSLRPIFITLLSRLLSITLHASLLFRPGVKVHTSAPATA